MLKVLALLLFCPLFLLAQDSPMQAAPGSPPPPQGWNPGANPNGGIHLPGKSSKKKYKLKMGPGTATPTKASPTPAK